MGDEYVVGQPMPFLERACTESDPDLTVSFYLSELPAPDDGRFVFKARSRAAATNAPMGAQIRVTANDRWLGETWFPPTAKELTLPVPPESLRRGWNRITLRWVSGSEWVAWDRLSLSNGGGRDLTLGWRAGNE